ncbi:MAG: hypothetical protein WCD57_24920 [Acidobacteriaceae bacterium]
MKSTSEIPSAGSPARGFVFGSLEPEARRGFLVQLVIVFLISCLVLAAGMSRRPGMFDEGITLTGAMRVAAGQVPHRDFYFLYGPAEVYILAGLFKVFGPSLLVERLFDLLLKGLIVTSVYAIALSYTRRSIAIFVSIVTVMWLFGSIGWGSATTPVSPLNLIGSALILPVFAGRLSTGRMLAAGAISGAAALFRHDTGIALLGIHACVISIAVYLQFTGTANRLRIFASTFWPYLLGFALLTVPPALYYFSVAPLAPLVHDVILYPGKYYRSDRGLPFPAINLKGLENLGVYLPIAIACVTLYILVRSFSRARGHAASGAESIPREDAWRGFLITFGLLLAVMYVKGLVRVSPGQVHLAVIPSLLLIAVLFQQRLAFPRPLRITIDSLMLLSLVAAAWSSLHEMRMEYAEHLSAGEWALSSAPDSPLKTSAAWCKIASPLTRGFCFLPEDDRIRAIEFISSHTGPGQSLYSGLKHHDRIFANDDLIYFATQRLPATHWSQLDPGLQTSYDTQTQMIHELERNAPPYIVLDSEFDLTREPNDSAKSSGVTLLDDYIRDKYQPVETFGIMSIRRRGSP